MEAIPFKVLVEVENYANRGTRRAKSTCCRRYVRRSFIGIARVGDSQFSEKLKLIVNCNLETQRRQEAQVCVVAAVAAVRKAR